MNCLLKPLLRMNSMNMDLGTMIGYSRCRRRSQPLTGRQKTKTNLKNKPLVNMSRTVRSSMTCLNINNIIFKSYIYSVGEMSIGLHNQTKIKDSVIQTDT